MVSPAFSSRHRFSDWLNPEVPAVAAGVYHVWDIDTLMYCGMSGREVETNGHRSRYGLVTRLQSHASGRLSGDEFSVYIANRLVIPALSPVQFPRFASGELNLDRLTKAYIHDHFEYQYAVVESSSEAFALEKRCRDGSIFGVKPLLNPA